MDEEQQATNTQNPANSSPAATVHSHRWYYAAVLILLILAIAAPLVVYKWQHKAAASVTKTGSVGASDSNDATSGFVSSTVVSYPLSLPGKEVMTTLVLPKSQSLLPVFINTKSQDELTTNYTESYNDILGNWEFNNTGTVAHPQDSIAVNPGITITALNDWMSKDDPASIGINYQKGEGPDIGPMTKSQKSEFAQKLKKDTASCASDSTKGFTTVDKVYDVCYSLKHPHSQGGDWTLNLSGYAELDGTLVYLRGDVSFPSATYQKDLQYFLKALKNTTSTVQKNPNLS